MYNDINYKINTDDVSCRKKHYFIPVGNLSTGF